MGSRIVPAVASAPIVITNTGTQMTFVFDGRNLSAGTSDPKHDLEWDSVTDAGRDEVRIQAIERTALTSAALPNLKTVRLQLSYNITNADAFGTQYNSDLNRPECAAQVYLDGHATLNLEESLFSAVGVASSFTYPAFASGTVPLASQISVKRVRSGVTTWLINGEDGSGRAADFSVNTTTRVVSLSGAGNTAAGDSYTVVYNRSASQFLAEFRGSNYTQAGFLMRFEKTRLNTQNKAGTMESVSFYGGLNGLVNFKEADQSGYPGATLGSVTTSVAWFAGIQWPTYDTLQVTRDGIRHSAANPIGYSTTPGGVTTFAIGFPVLGGSSSTDVNDLSVYVGGSLVNGIPTGGTKQNPNGVTYTIAASGVAPSYGTITFGSAPAAGLVYWKARNNNNLQILANEDGASSLLLGASGGVQSLKLQAFGSWDQRTATPGQFSVLGVLSVGQNNDPGLSGDANPTGIYFSRMIGTGSPRKTVNIMNIGGTALQNALLSLDGAAASTAMTSAHQLVKMSISATGADKYLTVVDSTYGVELMSFAVGASNPVFSLKDTGGVGILSISAGGVQTVRGQAPGTGIRSVDIPGNWTNKPGTTSHAFPATPTTWIPFYFSGGLVWCPAWSN